MPEVKDGKVVYTPEELAAATKQNDASAELRAAQVRLDTAHAALSNFNKLGQQAAKMVEAEMTTIRGIMVKKGG